MTSNLPVISFFWCCETLAASANTECDIESVLAEVGIFVALAYSLLTRKPTAMTVSPLRYFDEVTRQGSIRIAAERLHVAPSAISRHIRNLEDEIGMPLFERHARGVILTAAGEIYTDYALGLARSGARAFRDRRIEGIASRKHPDPQHRRGGRRTAVECHFNLSTQVSGHHVPPDVDRYRNRYPCGSRW